MKVFSMLMLVSAFAGSIANAGISFSRATPDGACALGVIGEVVVRTSGDVVEVSIAYPYGGSNTYTGLVLFSGLDKSSGLAFASLKGRSVNVCPNESYILIK